MKFALLEKAVELYEKSVTEEHVQYRAKSDEPKRIYDDFCKLNNLDKKQVELYQRVGYFYQKALPQEMMIARMNVMEQYTNKLAEWYLERGDKEIAADLQKIATELEV